ncbi:MAG: hypothetical protein AB8G18_19030 [Gammaproteobacteria bacterium]
MKVKILTILGVVALSAPAFAGGFDHYDKNADGVISADELGKKKAHKMAKMDANGDAVITREEFDAYKAEYKRNKKTS